MTYRLKTDNGTVLVTYSHAIAMVYHLMVEYVRGIPCWIEATPEL